MAGERLGFTPRVESTSVKQQLAEAKYGQKSAANGVVETGSGKRESAAEMGIWATEKVTMPLGFLVAVAAAPFAPIVSAAALAGVGTDYMGKEWARDEAMRLKKKRMAEAQAQAKKEGKVVLDTTEISAEVQRRDAVTQEMQKRKKIEMNLRAKQGTVYSREQVDLAA